MYAVVPGGGHHRGRRAIGVHSKSGLYTNMLLNYHKKDYGR
jgi:hypothetical protein